MRKAILSRRMIALLAAYVVALQALLLPLSVAEGSPFAGSLCASIAGTSPAPAGHDTGCPCAAGCGMQCCGHALAGPAQVSVALTLTLARVLTPVLALAPSFRPRETGSNQPRAPPAA